MISPLRLVMIISGAVLGWIAGDHIPFPTVLLFLLMLATLSVSTWMRAGEVERERAGKKRDVQ